MASKLKRTVSFFSREDERLIGEYDLDGIDLAGLQRLFHVPSDDPMYEMFPVGPEEAAVLRNHVAGEIDPEKYDYFVEAYTVDEPDEPAPTGALKPAASTAP